ncbi:MAG: S-layer homology domain-containing protein [Candidatus Sericytochromatia bacterium]
MAKTSIILSLAVSAVLFTAQAASAETRAEAVLKPAGDTRIVDLPAGHWATNATQVVLANAIITLDDGAFQGDRLLTASELKHAMNTLASTAEAIAAKGHNTTLRAAIGEAPTGDGPITRLRLAQTLASFLDACASQELVAIAAANKDASRFKDVGASVPPAVSTVVDKFKVMTGYPDNTFRPDGEVTRYQMAAIAYNVLNTMRMAPLAQLPVAAPAAPSQPTVIVVQQPAPAADPVEPAEVVPAAPAGRLNFRERSPIHLSYQAVNNNNLASGAPFATVPLEGSLTMYNGPLMLQNVTDVRVNVFQTNTVDTEFRAGYSGFKWGMLQAIPYVGAHLGMGTSAPANSIQYDSYVGASYGGILSITPTDNLEFHAQAGQTQLMAAGRFNSSFQPQAYPNALGSVLTNYGVGADFYIARNIALTLGFNSWQNPASLSVGNQTNATGVTSTFGANVGIGSSF